MPHLAPPATPIANGLSGADIEMHTDGLFGYPRAPRDAMGVPQRFGQHRSIGRVLNEGVLEDEDGAGIDGGIVGLIAVDTRRGTVLAGRADCHGGA